MTGPLDYWLGSQTPLSGTPFYLFAATINLAFLLIWIEDPHNDTRDNPAASIWQSVNLTGAFVIAAAHPYLDITQSLGGGWQAQVQFEVATIGWLFALPQSGTQWLQTLYALTVRDTHSRTLCPAAWLASPHPNQTHHCATKTAGAKLGTRSGTASKKIERLRLRIEAAEGRITSSTQTAKTPQ